MTALLNEPYLRDYRHRMFRLDPSARLKSMDQAMEYIIARGMIGFWPIKDIPIPNLWTAVAGDRPVADEHDDPGHITWGWKDDLLGKKRCFYARILCKRTFFISLDLLPYLYALSRNFGDFHEDHLILYEEGKLSFPARTLYDAILQRGALDTIELKKIGRFSGKTGDLEFNRALNELQMDFKLMPVGVSDSGAWHYSFIYDIVGRQFPDVVALAGSIQPRESRRVLLINYLQSVGAAHLAEIARLFRWDKASIRDCIAVLSDEGTILSSVSSESYPSSDWIALPELVLQ